MEGIFYPDTYHFTVPTTDADLLQRAYQKMQQELEKKWMTRAESLPYKTPYESLIAASLVEKETALAEERPLVAGVLVNRLKKGMRLRFDPTVIYALQELYTGNLTRADLRTQSPYNTYLHAGLPPTPIGLPSSDSLDAALHPSQDGYLYFVATGDGGHFFSESLAEHEQAVQRYLEKLRQRQSPQGIKVEN